MANIVLREKEFLKLNEELDKQTKGALEKKSDMSRTASPVFGSTAGIFNNRRISHEIDKFQLKANTRVATLKNSTLPRTELKKKRLLEYSSSIPSESAQIPINFKVDNSSQTTLKKPIERKVISQKTEIKNLPSKVSEKPSVKPKISQIKASTVPRNSRNLTAREQELIDLNIKLDILERKSNKANLRSSKDYVKQVRSPKLMKKVYEKASSQKLNRLSPTSVTKDHHYEIIETYRNKNFKESPSSDDIIFNTHLTDSTNTEITANLGINEKSMKKSTSPSIKKPQRKIVNTNDVCKKKLSTEGLIKYLKSKISIIEMELEDNQNELKKKSQELCASYDLQKKIELQRDQVIARNNTLTEQLIKMEEKLISVERKLKDREAEYGATIRDLEGYRREIKVVNQANVNLEKRLYKTNEDLENLKNHLASMKEVEREFKESARRDKEAHDKQIKALKKQKSDLLTAYKKQMFLIDNLRRQNVCMEQSKMISFGEKEFTKVLEWNMQN